MANTLTQGREGVVALASPVWRLIDKTPVCLTRARLVLIRPAAEYLVPQLQVWIGARVVLESEDGVFRSAVAARFALCDDDGRVLSRSGEIRAGLCAQVALRPEVKRRYVMEARLGSGEVVRAPVGEARARAKANGVWLCLETGRVLGVPTALSEARAAIEGRLRAAAEQRRLGRARRPNRFEVVRRMERGLARAGVALERWLRGLDLVEACTSSVSCRLPWHGDDARRADAVFYRGDDVVFVRFSPCRCRREKSREAWPHHERPPWGGQEVSWWRRDERDAWCNVFAVSLRKDEPREALAERLGLRCGRGGFALAREYTDHFYDPVVALDQRFVKKLRLPAWNAVRGRWRTSEAWLHPLPCDRA